MRAAASKELAQKSCAHQWVSGKAARKLRAAASWQTSLCGMLARMRRMPAARMAPASEGPPGTAPAAVDSGAGLIMPRESALQAPGAATGQAECECEAAASRAGVAQCCMVELSQQARPGMQ